MNIKSLGTALVVATALCGAEAGCQSAEEKEAEAALQATEDAIEHFAAMQADFSATLLNATGEAYEGSDDFVFMEDGTSTKNSVVYCLRSTVGFTNPTGVLFQDIQGDASCKRETFDPIRLVPGPGDGVGVSAVQTPQLVLKQTFSQSVEVDDLELTESAVINTEANGLTTGVEATITNKERCAVNGSKVPLSVCHRVFMAVKNALTETFRAGRPAHEALAARKTEWKTYNVPPFGTARLPEVENPDAGQSLDKNLPTKPTPTTVPNKRGITNGNNTL